MKSILILTVVLLNVFSASAAKKLMQLADNRILTVMYYPQKGLLLLNPLVSGIRMPDLPRNSLFATKKLTVISKNILDCKLGCDVTIRDRSRENFEYPQRSLYTFDILINKKVVANVALTTDDLTLNPNAFSALVNEDYEVQELRLYLDVLARAGTAQVSLEN